MVHFMKTEGGGGGGESGYTSDEIINMVDFIKREREGGTWIDI